ncbi:MAG: SdiA-regulated domain-containing protein [Bacteroidota bacterium]
MLRLVSGLILSLALSGCGNAEPRPAPQSLARTQADAPYRFDAPDARFDLPGRLDEISGLTDLGGGRLGAVQDEKGNLYVLDAATGEVVHEHDFGGGGDYEGVGLVGDRVVVLRSDGRLFVILDWQTEKTRAATLDTGLHGSCDAEGLAFDTEGERLLVACKERAGRGLRGARALYAFDLNRQALVPEPAFVVWADSLAGMERSLDEAVRSAVRPLSDINAFKPSAVGIHPLTGEVYVLSSVAKRVLVLARGGTIAAAWPLPSRLLPQPEGLAFLPDGTLFIASEAAGGDATLLRFAYHPVP